DRQPRGSRAGGGTDSWTLFSALGATRRAARAALTAQRDTRFATFAPARILYAASAMSLQGTSAVVTGGASGMGEATGRRLAAEGAEVVVVDRDADKGKAVASDIKGLFCEADVTDEESVRAAVAAAVELAPLRTCIHCAGVGWAERTLDR